MPCHVVNRTINGPVWNEETETGNVSSLSSVIIIIYMYEINGAYIYWHNCMYDTIFDEIIDTIICTSNFKQVDLPPFFAITTRLTLLHYKWMTSQIQRIGNASLVSLSTKLWPGCNNHVTMLWQPCWRINQQCIEKSNPLYISITHRVNHWIQLMHTWSCDTARVSGAASCSCQ